MKDAIELWIKIVTVCVAVFGVGKYFYDLALDRGLAARSESLERIAEFDSGPVDEARKSLFDFWIANSDAAHFLGHTETSSNAYRSFLLPAFLLSSNSRKLFDAVYTVVQHYDGVFFCLDAEICDPEVLYKFYCPKAISTRTAYLPVIETLKNQSAYSNFGIGLDSIVQNCKAMKLGG